MLRFAGKPKPNTHFNNFLADDEGIDFLDSGDHADWGKKVKDGEIEWIFVSMLVKYLS